jgi:hypothetical protein
VSINARPPSGQRCPGHGSFRPFFQHSDAREARGGNANAGRRRRAAGHGRDIHP